jgi:hypothetical protein
MPMLESPLRPAYKISLMPSIWLCEASISKYLKQLHFQGKLLCIKISTLPRVQAFYKKDTLRNEVFLSQNDATEFSSCGDEQQYYER